MRSFPRHARLAVRRYCRSQEQRLQGTRQR
nr:MAG TPA: hypothetical protein [Caudoviricetes sp.]